MSLDADHIVDRRRMRRKLTFWRVTAIVIAALAVIGLAVGLSSSSRGIIGVSSPYIARITIEGLIQSNRDRVKALDKLAQASAVKAVIVHINSPGGTTAGSEELHNALLRIKAKKPIVTVVDGLAASGAYIAAIAADHIVAHSSSLVGSIGVLFTYPDFTQLMKTVGISVDSIKSSPLKASPSPFEPTPPGAREAIQSVVMDAYAWFRGLVRDGRKMNDAELNQVADGRVFTGRQSVDLKLVDELGEEKEAIVWLNKQRGVAANLPVRDYDLESRFSELPFLHAAAARVLETLGLSALARQVADLGALRAIERLNLDGLLALWHPSAN